MSGRGTRLGGVHLDSDSERYSYPIWSKLLVSLVPRPLPRKTERGSGVLSDISCHMGRGQRRKECNYCIPVHVHRTAGILDLVLDDVLQSDSSSLIGEL